jgi:hypothetical protein
MGFIKPALTATGAAAGGIIGGMAGGPAAPVTGVAGAALGGAAGAELAETIGQMSGVYPTTSLSETLGRTANEAMMGGLFEMGGQVAGQAIGATAKWLGNRPTVGRLLDAADKRLSAARERIAGQQQKMSEQLQTKRDILAEDVKRLPGERQAIEQYAHDQVERVHGSALPAADNIATPTSQRLEATTQDAILESLAHKKEVQRAAGEQIGNFEDTLQAKQAADGRGFWDSTIGRNWWRQTRVRMGKAPPRPGEELPKFGPSAFERKMVKDSVKNLRSVPVAGTDQHLPVTAEAIKEEISRLSRLANEQPSGSANIKVIKDYQQSLVQALEKYSGVKYPSQAYREASIDMRKLEELLGATFNPKAAKGQPQWKITGGPNTIFRNAQSYTAAKEALGDSAANELLERHIANQLQGKGPKQALDWVNKQKWWDEASPSTFEKTMTYLDSLSARAKDITTRQAIIKVRTANLNRYGQMIQRIGADKSQALLKVEEILNGSTGPRMIEDFRKLAPSLTKSGAMNEAEIAEMDAALQKIGQIVDRKERNSALVKYVAKKAFPAGLAGGAFGAGYQAMRLFMKD